MTLGTKKKTQAQASFISITSVFKQYISLLIQVTSIQNMYTQKYHVSRASVNERPT